MSRWIVPVGLALAVSACVGGTIPDTAPVTTTPREPGSTSDAAPEAWDLVYVSDSGGWGVAERYAALASAALRREVRVHDRAIGGLRAVEALDRIRGVLAGEIADAEIVVIYGNPDGSGLDLPQPDIGTCVSTSVTEREPPVVTTVDDWRPYRELLDEIYAEIRMLREGRPTVLRAVDLYSPVISQWRAAGIEGECTANWEVWSQVIREAAEANGAVMVSTYDVFNGPDHDQDPREKGWIGPDGEHTTPEGAAAIAGALHAVGYEPSTGPG